MPHQWHSYKPDIATGWEEYWIRFYGNLVDNYIMKELFPDQQTYVKNLGYHEEFIYLLQQALRLSKKNSEGFQRILGGIIWQLVAYTLVSNKNPNVPVDLEHIKEVTINIIRQQLKTKIDFAKLAGTMNLSYSHYRKLIRENLGKAPHQLLIEERLALANRLLLSTNLSITQIAEQTGFESVYYFSRRFKKRYKVSPLKKRLQDLKY